MESAPSIKLISDQTVEQRLVEDRAKGNISTADTNTNEIDDASSVSSTTLESHQIKSNVSSGLHHNQTRQSETTSGDENETKECTTEAEDFEKYTRGTFRRLRTLSVKIIQIDKNNFTNDEETLTRIKTELRFIEALYFSVEDEGFSRHLYEGYQKELCDVLLELDLLSQFVKLLEEITRDTDFRYATNDQKKVIKIIMSLLYNCTDMSDPFANAVAKSSVIEFTKNFLDANYHEYIADASEPTTICIIRSCHGIALNVSMREANVERLRDLDYTTSLAPYLKSTDPEVNIPVLATLANVVSERECEIISNHILAVAQLLIFLNKGMAEESRRCEGWSCREIAVVVRQLARNDANKKLLFELKALKPLVELAKSKDEEEQLESVLAILTLSFDDTIRVDITTKETLGVIDVLLDLKKTSENNDIKSACEKTLWNLKDDLLSSAIPSYRSAGEQMQQKNETRKKTGHVMISYQHNDRKLLLTIKEKLKQHNFKVWMDVDEMGGCVYETMAQAVENANVFLMCYSRKYKESENCQYEAKYAHKTKKAVIPLKMEMGYEPDAWLGLLLKSDYYIELSGKYDNEKKFVELIAYIRKIWPTGYDYVDAPILPKETNFARIVLKKKWSQEVVDKWLENNGLKNQGLDTISGLEISYMTRMLIKAPEQLHYCLRKDLGIKTLSTKAKIVWALEDLANQEE